jgi:large subunit ribosomal protein L11e
MDIYVVLGRPGFRVARRRRKKNRVGVKHRVTKQEAIKWFQEKYEGIVRSGGKLQLPTAEAAAPTTSSQTTTQ